MERPELERLLPSVFRRALRAGDPLDAILAVMTALHQPVEEILARVDSYIDPSRAPDRLVPYLAAWVDLDRLFDPSLRFGPDGIPGITTGPRRLRDLVRHSCPLAHRRGTAFGL